jgi:hypothetical protein
LGNFVFDQNFSTDTMSGLMLSVSVIDKHISTVEQIPVTISRQYQPMVQPTP